ncbi:ZC3H3 protein, partial [Grallaria varia]|nr:ZC3H3 protein [Grallaria varia]
ASGSTSETAVTLKSEPQEPLELPGGRERAGNSGWLKAEPPAAGRSWEELQDASVNPKFPGNAEAPSTPAQVGAIPGKSGFPGIPKASPLPRAASTPLAGKSPKFRTNAYTWEANPGKNSRLGKRWTSPRAESARKGLGADRGAKISPRESGAKGKKSGMPSKVGVSPSKYKWKASNLPALPSTSKSAFRWRSEDQGKLPPDPRVASVGVGATEPFGEAALAGYKVKSRTKIIRRKGNVGFPADKKSVSPGTAPRSRFQLRRRNSGRGKPSAAPRRSWCRLLVQVSRHRLRRIPAAKEGTNFPFSRSPPANKVIKTRYRIVKKNVTSPALSSFSSPVPTWKTKRPGTSR